MARQPLFGRRFDAGRQQLQNNPQYRMALQAQQRGTSTDPVSSPWEGLARALQAPIGALAAGQQEAAMRERQSERNQQVTDMLLGDRGMTGETEPGTGARAQSPQRQQMEEQLMGALESGLVQPQDLSGVMMQQMGLGPKAEPIEINGRLVDPNTYEVIQDFSDPNIRSVNGRLVNVDTGQVMADFSDPKTLGKSDLVQIMTDQGPQYVRASQAEGRRPYESGSQTQADREIQSLMNQGVEREEAENIAYGRVRYQQDPVTGSLTRINEATGEAERVDVPMPDIAISGTGGQSGEGGGQAAGQAQGQGQNKPILADVSVYGPKGSLGEAAQRGTFGAYDPGAEQTQQRQRIRLLREKVLDAYARSGRPSNYAQRRVEELLPSTGVFESPSRAYDVMNTLHQEMQQEYQTAQEIYQNPAIPPDQKKEAIATLYATRDVMRDIGDPSQFDRPSPSPDSEPPQIQSMEDWENLPSGTTYIDPQGRTRRKQ